MAGPNPRGIKRQKELLRLQRQAEKRADREERKKAKKDKPEGLPGQDPDIAGIVPGPQPPLEE